MKRVLAALCVCVLGYGAAVAVLIVEHPDDAPEYVSSLSLWYQRDKPAILIVNVDGHGPGKTQIAPIVFRDEDNCERFRLMTPVDDQMRHSACMPRAYVFDDSRGLDREHLAVSPSGVWFYQP